MSDESQQSTVTEPVQATEPQATPIVDPATMPAAVTESTEVAQVTEESSDTMQASAVEPPKIVEDVPVAAPQTKTEEGAPSLEESRTEALSATQPPVIETPTHAPSPAQNTATPPQAMSSAPAITTLRPQAQAARTGRIQKKLEKIMEFVREKKVIRNDDIEKLLHVSDSTAQRYLGTLVKQGKLRRVGNRGSAHYELA